MVNIAAKRNRHKILPIQDPLSILSMAPLSMIRTVAHIPIAETSTSGKHRGSQGNLHVLRGCWKALGIELNKSGSTSSRKTNYSRPPYAKALGVPQSSTENS